MRVKVNTWGNSLALRIPRSVAKQLQLEQGCEVELATEDGVLLVKPVAYTLDALLSQVTPENLHAETATGAVLGEES